MKVALVTEGTYPLHSGGVSQWCDHLVRGLPDVDFEVVVLSGSGQEQAVYALPPNVRSVRRLGLWAATRRSPPFRGGTVVRFTTAYRQFLEAMLADDKFAPSRFEEAVRGLHALAREGRLTSAMRSQASIEMLLTVWRRHIRRTGERPMTLADALTAADYIEHYLRPLLLPPLEVDVVHATANGPSALVGLVTKWANGTPLLMSEHGVYLRERILAVREDGGSRAVRTMLVRFLVRLTELGYRTADAVLPVSHFNARWAVRNGAAPATVRTVYNGVDPAQFPPVQWDPALPTLLFAGRIDPLKDIETLIRAFALVRERVPDARLRLFGPVPAGNEAYAAGCEKLVGELGLADVAHFDGPITPIRRAFEGGQVIVLSSISEGLPLTVIEAAMAGRAVVATDVGGMAEAVGEGGLVVPARDPHAFADACVRLLLDSALRRRLAAAGRHRAQEVFTLDRLVADFRELYGAAARRDVLPRSVPPLMVSAR